MAGMAPGNLCALSHSCRGWGMKDEASPPGASAIVYWDDGSVPEVKEM